MTLTDHGHPYAGSVNAVAVGDSPFRNWPSPQPTSGNPSADCLGVVLDTAEFALWLSPDILANTDRVLATVLKTPDEEVDDYLRVLAEMAEASGGGITDPPQTVGDCPDWADNRILDLAAAVGAFLIVSADADLTSMSPWRGPAEHRAVAVRVDGRRLPPGARTATVRTAVREMPLPLLDHGAVPGAGQWHTETSRTTLCKTVP
jgi:predicted nucleic acid-binding protein